MPLKISTHPNLIHVKGFFLITPHDLDTYYDRLKKHYEKERYEKILFDLSAPDIEIKFGIPSIIKLANNFKTVPLMPPGGQIAIVVKSSLHYGFVRMFMGYRGGDIRIRPFKKRPDAFSWLEISESESEIP